MKNITKKPTSKAKSDKPIRYPFSREEQLNRSDSLRRKLFDRRSNKSKLHKAKRAIQLQFPNCKLYSLQSAISLKQENFQLPSNDSLFIYNINYTQRDRYTTKRIVTSSEIEPPVLWGKDPETGYELLKKIQKRKFSIWKRMNFENDSQPNYGTQTNFQKREDSKSRSTIKPIKLPNIEHQIVNFAKRYFAEYKSGNKTLSYVKRNLAEKKASYPQGIDNFKRWAGGTSEGREFMAAIFNVKVKADLNI